MNPMKKLLIFLLFSTMTFAQKDLSSAEKFQSELNKSYADSLKSPLTKEDLKAFKGLDFFSINEKYIVEATFIRTKKEKPFGMKTTTSRTPLYKKYGELYFEIDGKAFKLNVFITYSFGNVVRLNPCFNYQYSDLSSMPREFKNRWTVPGDEKHTGGCLAAGRGSGPTGPGVQC